MKKTILFAAVTLLCVTAFVMMSDSADAADTTGGKCGDNLTWSFDSSNGTLTISGSGKMTDYGDSKSSVGEQAPWVSKMEEVKKIVIKDGVTSIGNNAFLRVDIYEGSASAGVSATLLPTVLESVTIPNSVTSVGDYAFCGCTKLTSVSGDLSGVTSIGKYAFARCPLGTSDSPCSLKLDNVTSIGNYAFRDCTALTSVTLGDNLTNLGNSAFLGAAALITVTIPNNITSIEANMFMNCTSLTKVEFKNNITSIGSSAFSGCTSLTSVGDLTKVKDIGQGSFMGTKLTSVTFTDELSSIGDQAFKNCTFLDTVILGNKVKTILTDTFFGCTSLKNIDLSNITSIGNTAFFGCTSLTSVDLKNVTTLGKQAFVGCKSLTSVEDLSKVTVFGIDGTIFKDCTSLKTVNLGSTNLKEIPTQTFQGCTSLTEVKFGSSVTTIGNSAFFNCTKLSKVGNFDPSAGDGVACLGSVTTISNTAFSGCTSLKNVTLGNVTAIPSSLFKGCTSLETVTGLGEVTSVDNYAFSGCTNLKTVDLSNVTTINQQAFSNCAALTSAGNLSHVTTIGDSAFSGCAALTSVTLGNNITAIGYSAFSNCTSLESLTVRDENVSTGTLEIKSSAFSKCTSLKTVVFNGEGENIITKIGSSAFSNCFSNNITDGSVTAGYDQVFYIGESAFSGCTGLKSMDCNGIYSIGESAFSGCKSLETIDFNALGYGSNSIGKETFYNCSALNEIDLSGITTIGDKAFYNCTSLTSYWNTEEGYKWDLRYVESIGKEAFYGCTSLDSLTIYFDEAHEKSIGESAFSGCTSLTTITIGYEGTTINSDDSLTIGCTAFFDCSKLSSLTVSSVFKGLTLTVESRAFDSCSELNTVTLPDTVSIDDSSIRNLFSYCAVFKSIDGHQTVVKYGIDAINKLLGPKPENTDSDKAECKYRWEEYSLTGAALITVNEIDEHILEKTPAKVPTCTDSGNNEYYTCSVCGKIFRSDKTTVTTVEGETLEAKGHIYIKVEKKSATAEVPGNIEYYTCSGCGKYFTGIDEKTETTAEAVKTYIIRFVNGISTYHSKEYRFGEKIEVPADPKKDADAQYTYVFKKWVDENNNNLAADATVTACKTYTAQFDKKYNEYDVIFIGEDGTKLYSTRALYGDIPVFTGSNPYKQSTSEYTYEFKGWSAEEGGNVIDLTKETVKGDVTYYAIFDSTPQKYDVKYTVYGTSSVEQIHKETHAYGSEVTVKDVYTKTGYDVSEWKAEGITISEDGKFTMPAHHVFFEATLTIKSYTLTFVADGKTVGTRGYTMETTTITPPAVPEKEGYTGVWEKYNLSDLGNKTVNAVYTVNSYTITFDSDGGSSVDAVTQNYGTTVSAPSEPTKTGYTFQHWALDGEKYNFGSMPAKNITLTAVWKINSYTVKYLVDGKALEQYPNKTYDYNSEVTVSEAYTKTGYTVSEWKAEGITVTGGKFFMPAGDVTFNATSTANKYTLTINFVYEDGTKAGESDITECTYGMSYSRWAIKLDGYTATPYSIVTGSMPANDLTVTVTYKINQYTITFNSDGGSDVANITDDYKKTVTAPENPVKTGYTFQYWTLDGTEYTFSTMPAKNITLKAAWKINQYTIAFDSDGGSEVEDITANYNAGITAPEKPTKTGYTFQYWVEKDSNVKYGIPAYMPADNVSLKAVWMINTYTVKFMNEGTELQTITVEHGKAPVYSGKAPEKAQTSDNYYNFKGWSVSAEGTETVALTDVKITGDVTYYAHFEEVPLSSSYTVTYKVDNEVIETVKYVSGTEVTLRDVYVKTGYDVGEWTTADTVTITGGKFTMPANDVTFTATSTVKTYKVTFIVDKKESSEMYAYGTPAAGIEQPKDLTKEATAQYEYLFSGWDKEITTVTGDVTYTAAFTGVLREYTIAFKNGDETLKSYTVKYGNVPEYNGETPTKADSVGSTYTFKGWSPGIVAVSGDAVYTADFTETPRKYTVTFDINGTESSAEYDYGTSADTIRPENPTKESDDQYAYKFKGWSVNGEIVEISSVAGAVTYTAEFENVAHTYSATYDWSDLNTCVAVGKCTVCGHTVTESVISSSAVTKEATCKEEGVTTYTAVFTYCGTDTKNVSIDKADHNYVEHKATEAKCETPGNKLYYTCSVCDKVFDSGKNVTTLDEQTIPAVGHNLEKIDAKPVTCTDDGYEEYYKCKSCDALFSDGEGNNLISEPVKITKKGHTPVVDGAVEPTCTEAGKTEGSHCSVCGAVITAQNEVPATGHKEETVPGKAATCAEAGLTDGLRCTVCGAVTKAQEPISATGHKEETVPGKVATCTETGLTDGIKCSVCNEVLTEQTEIPAKGHTEVTVSGKAATCTEKGLTDGKKCSVCNEVLTEQTEIPAKGHTEVTVSGKAATCTEKGLTDGKKCSVCNEVLTEQTEIPAKGHTEVTVSGKAATCTEKGLTDGKKCSVCNEVLTEQTEIPAKGHTEVTIPASETAEYRLTEGKMCSVCNKTLVPQTKITVTSKQNEDGTMTEVQTYTTDVGSDKVETVLKKIEGSTGASEISTVIKTSGSEVSDNTVTKALEQMGSESSEKKTVTIDNTTSSESEEKKTEATISAEALSNIKAVGAETEIKGDLATLKISQNAIGTLVASGEKVSLSAAYANSSSELTAEQKEKIGSAPLFKLDASAGDTVVSKFGGNITVTLPYTLPEGKAAGDVAVYYLGDDGKFAPADSCSYSGGYVTFTTDHFSYWTITDSKIVYDEASGSSDSGSGSNAMIIAVAVIAVIAVIGCAFVFLRMRAKTN